MTVTDHDLLWVCTGNLIFLLVAVGRILGVMTHKEKLDAVKELEELTAKFGETEALERFRRRREKMGMFR